jgi:hypothetical protein
MLAGRNMPCCACAKHTNHRQRMLVWCCADLRGGAWCCASCGYACRWCGCGHGAAAIMCTAHPQPCATVCHVHALGWYLGWAVSPARVCCCLVPYLCVRVLVRAHGRACTAVWTGLWVPVLLCGAVCGIRRMLLCCPCLKKGRPPLDRACHTPAPQDVCTSMCPLCAPHTLSRAKCMLLVVPRCALWAALLQD